jgi:hypothetical protein
MCPLNPPPALLPLLPLPPLLQSIVSLFRTRGAPLHKLSDVIIHCDGSHFTLLRAFSPEGAGVGAQVRWLLACMFDIHM